MAKKLKNELVTGNRSQAEQMAIDLIRLYCGKIIILPNDKTAIGRELDLYLPEHKIGIEIDGPTHSEPIFGQATLERTIQSDERKTKLCEDNNILLIRIPLPKESSTYFSILKHEIKAKVVPKIKKTERAENSALSCHTARKE
jgi:hypothetical protein